MPCPCPHTPAIPAALEVIGCGYALRRAWWKDMTTSLRACLAAEAWKKLFPDENRGAHKKEGAKSPKVDFSTFAHQTFKVGKSYAKQALAILNHDPSGELLTHLNGHRCR